VPRAAAGSLSSGCARQHGAPICPAPAEALLCAVAAAQRISGAFRPPPRGTRLPSVGSAWRASVHARDRVLRGGRVVQAFEAFAEREPAVFEAVGTTRDGAQAKMRLMALLGLASGAPSVSFQQIQVWKKVPGMLRR
jgi:hypothetical protein